MGARRPSGDGGSRDIDRLIIDTFESGRELTAEELRAIREHVVQRGFNPAEDERVQRRIAGVEWNGRILKSSDRIPSLDVHWLRHRDEWPVPLTREEYQNAVEAVVRSSGPVILHNFNGEWIQLAFLGQVNDGTSKEWLVVEYRPNLGHITTAFRVVSPEAEFSYEHRRLARWVVTPP